MTILDKIVATKKEELAAAKKLFPKSMLMDRPLFHQPAYSVKQAIQSGNTSGIITEFKRRSPSKGWINEHASLQEVCRGYAASGASAISVLTDSLYFGGSLTDLQQVRQAVAVPLLRKDFMIDEYQIIEAKSMGADVVLLIAAALSPSEVKTLGTLARSLGMETLLEVHDQEELDRSVGDYISVVGVNNRNLKNFSEQNVEASKVLADKIPAQFVKISESCISSAEIIKELKTYGYRGFLIGESFMKTTNPGAALTDFLK